MVDLRQTIVDCGSADHAFDLGLPIYITIEINTVEINTRKRIAIYLVVKSQYTHG